MPDPQEIPMHMILLNARIPQIGEIIHNTIHAVAGKPMAFALVIAGPGGEHGRVLAISNVDNRDQMIALLAIYLEELKESGREIVPATPADMPRSGDGPSPRSQEGL